MCTPKEQAAKRKDRTAQTCAVCFGSVLFPENVLKMSQISYCNTIEKTVNVMTTVEYTSDYETVFRF